MEADMRIPLFGAASLVAAVATATAPLALGQLVPNCARTLQGFRSTEVSSVSSSVVWDRDGAGPEKPLIALSFNADLDLGPQ
jgi:hypothetical protein